MRLSTAIHIGSMTTKQIMGEMTDGGNGRCALGAALEAANITIHDIRTSDIPNVNFNAACLKWPILNDRVHNPVSGLKSRLLDVVWILNDCHGWSRDAISDFVESIENEHEAKQMEAKEKQELLEEATTLKETA